MIGCESECGDGRRSRDKRIDKMKEIYSYSDMIDAAVRMNEINDCSVKALALALNIPYEMAHADLAAHGRKPRSGTYSDQVLNVLRDWGVNMSMAFWPRNRLSWDSLLSEYNVTNVIRERWTTFTIGSMMRDHPITARGTWIVFVNKHVLTVRNGEILDWTGGVGNKKKSRRHVQFALRIDA